MTIESRPRTSRDIEADLAATRRDLEAARELEVELSQKVDAARADHAVGRLVRTVLLGHQRQLAAAQSRVADLEWKAKGLERLASELAAAERAEREAAAAARRSEFVAEQADLDRRTADVVATAWAMFNDLEAAYRDLNSRAGGYLPGLRGPGSMPRVRDQLHGALSELTRLYGPKAATTIIRKEG